MSNIECVSPSSATRAVEFLTIDENSDLQRIDNFLITHWKGVPKSHIYRLLRKGEIRVNKKRVKPETRLHTGDLLRLPPVRKAQATAPEPPGTQLLSLVQNAVLYEDADFLVVNKPQGIAVHAGTGNRVGFVEALRWHCKARDKTDTYLELAHRIDKETSGCLVLAKSASALKYVQGQLKARRVTKIYQALVYGRWPESLTTVDIPLQKVEISAKAKVVRVSEDGKPSLTQFRIIRKLAEATLIEARPATGRMHQIRVHCQHAGHPIVGDPKYTRLHEAKPENAYRLCLHAAAVSFELPSGHGKLEVEAPVSAAMSATIELFSKPSSSLR